MRRIGIRELRQNASVWLRKVEAGESFEITNRGRRVALLVPASGGNDLERLRVAGRVATATEDLLALGEPLSSNDDLPSPSEVLERMRADER